MRVMKKTTTMKKTKKKEKKKENTMMKRTRTTKRLKRLVKRRKSWISRGTSLTLIYGQIQRSSMRKGSQSRRRQRTRRRKRPCPSFHSRFPCPRPLTISRRSSVTSPWRTPPWLWSASGSATRRHSRRTTARKCSPSSAFSCSALRCSLAKAHSRSITST